MLALYIVLFLTTLYVPFIGTITMFALSLPFIVFTARNSWKSGLFLFTGALILTLLFGSLYSIPMTLMMGSTGVLMGYMFKQKRSKFEILSLSSVTIILNLLLVFVIASTIFNMNLSEYFAQASEQTITMTREMMGSLGQTIDTEKLEELEKAMELASTLLPTVLVIIGLIFALISQLIATPVLNRLGFQIEKWPPLRSINIPKSMIWYYLISTLLMLTPLEKGSFIYLAVVNLYYILQLLMIFQGISFVFYYCHRKNLAKGIPIIIVIVALLLPFMLSIIRFIGIIDLGFNLRSKIEQKK